jgi:hypothetical protein
MVIRDQHLHRIDDRSGTLAVLDCGDLFRADIGNFNRFLTSVGLVLIAAALAVPYFYLRDTDTLRISRYQLKGLTTTGRETMEDRQRRVADFEIPVLYLAGVAGVGGIFCIFLGGKRLRTAQKNEDDDRALVRKERLEKYEVQKRSRDEIEKDRDRQAEESVEPQTSTDERRNVEREAGSPRPTSPGPAEESHEGTVEPIHIGTGSVALNRARITIGRVEETVQDALGEAHYERFRYLSEIQIVTGLRKSRRIDLDGLFESVRSVNPDVALELKVANSAVALTSRRSSLFADQVLALLTRYEEVTGRSALGWLLIVVSGDAKDLGADAALRAQDRFDDLLGGKGRCTVLGEVEIGDAPDRFRSIFGS